MFYKCTAIFDGKPQFTTPIGVILATVRVGGGIEILDPDEFITAQQRKWWKGVLLKALSKDTGESISVWEVRLKLAVMPDEFQPTAVTVHGKPYLHVPSVNILTVKKMNQLIEGAVDYLRSIGFDWVTLPDSELRK